MHGDKLRGRNDINPRVATVAGKFLFDRGLLANEDNGNVEVANRLQRSFNDGAGGMIPAHRVDGDFSHVEGYSVSMTTRPR